MNFVFNQAALTEYREAAIQAILKDPRRCQPVGNGCQVFRLKHFPYKLYYLHELELITIYAVMHDRRKPDVWRDRLK